MSKKTHGGKGDKRRPVADAEQFADELGQNI